MDRETNIINKEHIKRCRCMERCDRYTKKFRHFDKKHYDMIGFIWCNVSLPFIKYRNQKDNSGNCKYWSLSYIIDNHLTYSFPKIRKLRGKKKLLKYIFQKPKHNKTKKRLNGKITIKLESSCPRKVYFEIYNKQNIDTD